MARPLRPLAPAVYIGVVLALVGAQHGGVVWMVGGVLATFLLAFVLNAVAKTRAPSTVAIGATVLGATWIGLGLGAHPAAPRAARASRGCSPSPCCIAVWAADTFAYFAGRLFGRHKLAPSLSPGKTWEGFVVGSLAGVFVVVHRALRHARHVS